ncbi:hypothetical protein CW354_15115 [Marinicaulis flavus]|uniref:Uncharacterized protein n=1 Tax=Hyphococcus luteus TaxID=2058213 RepID=A0A2S7K2T2_9PROT|nr:hypothetical protein CW354_15115 [Marinicaulis flavus]
MVAVGFEARTAVNHHEVAAGFTEQGDARLNGQDRRVAARGIRADVFADIDAAADPVRHRNTVAIVIFKGKRNIGKNCAGDVADDLIDAGRIGTGNRQVERVALGETGRTGVRRHGAACASAAAAARRRARVCRSRRFDIAALRTGDQRHRCARKKKLFHVRELAH